MEIEPNKSKVLVTNLLVKFFEVLAELFLFAFLINEIDKSTVLVMLFDIVIVFLCDFKVQFIISVNTHFRVPLKIRILSPEEWHRSSELNV